MMYDGPPECATVSAASEGMVWDQRIVTVTYSYVNSINGCWEGGYSVDASIVPA